MSVVLEPTVNMNVDIVLRSVEPEVGNVQPEVTSVEGGGEV